MVTTVNGEVTHQTCQVHHRAETDSSGGEAAIGNWPPCVGKEQIRVRGVVNTPGEAWTNVHVDDADLQALGQVCTLRTRGRDTAITTLQDSGAP